ncbi:MAG TPA: Ig-like domain-containing protein [Candidatus Eisenbacteria bacterium]|nr:Ig-like domain-containing protein [Candidatus Eisenbacteria bacterium]
MRKGIHYLATAALVLGLAAPALAASEPVVGPIAQTSATANASTTLSATYADPDGVTGCELLINGSSQGAMTLSGGSGSTSGVASASYTFNAAGSFTAQARCTDTGSHVGTGGSTTVSVSASGAVAVGSVSPMTATAGVQTTLSANYDLNANVANCHLLIDGADTGAMTLSSSTSTGTASATYTFAAAGSHTAQVTCADANGATSTGASTAITVSSGNGLTVGAVSPTSATTNASASLSATYSGSAAVSSCGLFIDGSLASNMSLSGTTSGTASASYTFTASGTHTAQVRCTDANGTLSSGAITTVTASASAAVPNVGAVSPLTATANAQTTLSASYSLSANATGCSLYIDGTLAKAMNLSGSASSSGTASATYTFTTSGTHSAQARCTDANGTITGGATTSILVTASGTGDVIPPTAPQSLVLTTPSSDNTATLTWSASTDNTGVARYDVSLDGGAYVSNGSSLSYTTSALPNGSHSLSVKAVDAAGNASSATTLGFVIDMGSSSGTVLGSGFALELMNSDALFVVGNHTRADYEARISRGCEMSADAAAQARARALGDVTNAQARANIEAFLACGTQTTLHLGAGERLGIVNSFRAAFGKIPDTQEDWFDVIKIGNGRFPGRTNASAESRAHATFRLVWLRDANTSVTADNNAIVILAYGLRPLPRSLSSEAQALATFSAVYHRMPSSAIDWDTVRAIAYSGATR